MSEFAGRHVVITGGGSGVGAQMAVHFTALGATVSIFGRRPGPLEGVAARTGARAFHCDVTSAPGVAAALAEARAGAGPVAIAIANAGAASSNPFDATSPENLQDMLSVNVVGVFNLWRACLDDMRASGWGRMVAVASTAGLKGYPYVSGYCAAKHAVIGLVRSLSLELARTGITVNAVCPGFVETPMLERSIDNIVATTGVSEAQATSTLQALNPMRRFVTPQEVASAAAWLATRGAGSVNGQAIAVNGGEV